MEVFVGKSTINGGLSIAMFNRLQLGQRARHLPGQPDTPGLDLSMMMHDVQVEN